MQAAMIKTPMPASKQLSGLNPPIRAARTAGNPKIPAPMIEFTISAVRLQRPMTRTSAFGDGPGAGEKFVSGKHGSILVLAGAQSFASGTAAVLILPISVKTSGFPAMRSRCG
jgi:hypothetical protein